MEEKHWYELHKYLDDDEFGPDVERFMHDDTNLGMHDARARMIARVAVARAIVPAAKFKGYACTCTREKLDWVE